VLSVRLPGFFTSFSWEVFSLKLAISCSDEGLILWLRENVDMMNYSQIMENEQIRSLIAGA
jgi:hypothetical protein